MSRSPIFAIASLAFFAACGGGAPAGPVTVSLSEWKIEPTTITAKSGPLTFQIKNTGNLEHNFVIVGGERSKTVTAKDATTLDLTLKPGSYTVICDLPGHKEAGMTGRLEVK